MLLLIGRFVKEIDEGGHRTREGGNTLARLGCKIHPKIDIRDSTLNGVAIGFLFY